MDELTRFLETESRRKWCWQDTNCALWVADWIVRQTGVDPAVLFRGAATSADEWREFLIGNGGFCSIVGEAMDRLGFERTQSLARGDVAIVHAPVSCSRNMPVVGTIAAICVSGATEDFLWPLTVSRSLRGLHYERFSVATGWKLCKTQS